MAMTEIVLRVRLIGDLHDRIALMSARLGISTQEAARRVEEVDRQRTDFIKIHFHKDPREPHQYDLLMNVSRWSVADCAEVVVRALAQMQLRAPSDV